MQLQQGWEGNISGMEMKTLILINIHLIHLFKVRASWCDFKQEIRTLIQLKKNVSARTLSRETRNHNPLLSHVLIGFLCNWTINPKDVQYLIYKFIINNLCAKHINIYMKFNVTSNNSYWYSYQKSVYIRRVYGNIWVHNVYQHNSSL